MLRGGVRPLSLSSLSFFFPQEGKRGWEKWERWERKKKEKRKEGENGCFRVPSVYKGILKNQKTA
jgi:hypothetical protein